MKPWIGTAVLLTLAASCQEPEPGQRSSDHAPREAWDGLNAPQVFGNLQSMRYQDLAGEGFLQGVLAQRPWSDDYWPWSRGGLARRWLLPEQAIRIDVDALDYAAEVQTEIASFLDFAREADADTLQSLSPMEKYDLLGSYDFPVTTKELLEYANYSKYFEENRIPWDWMGSCDGWALATLKLPAPRYPVLASSIAGEPLLFTVGDIRGLLSKLYTDNHKSREGQVLGSRCNRRVAEIVSDAYGRVVDGTLGDWQDGVLVGGRNIRIVYNNWRLVGHQELSTSESVIVFRYADAPEGVYWLRAAEWADREQDIVRVEVRPTSNGQLDPSVPPTVMDFRYLKSCRDLNAGAFHIALAQLLSNAAATKHGGARGFVIEVSGADQVWNQPVYGYISRLGQPLDLQSLAPGGPQDPYGSYRAPGTRYLVHAYTTVYFGMENGPLVIYGEGDELLSYFTYQYTLELDANGYVIGGEWHQTVKETADLLAPLSGTALLERLGTQAASGERVNVPDFLWRYPEDTRILETCDTAPCLSAETVHRLAACSRDVPRPGDTVALQGQTIPFVRCAP